MSEPFLGQLMIVGFNFPPRGWAFCDGQILPISQNQSLYSLLGTTYGGDGRTTFALPDLRSRRPIHVGHGPGLSNYSWGQRGGAETVTLTTSQIPSHNHTLNAYGNDADALSPANHVWAKDPTGSIATYSNSTTAAHVPMNANSVSAAGGSISHTNLQPFIALYFCIALQGIFPSRG